MNKVTLVHVLLILLQTSIPILLSQATCPLSSHLDKLEFNLVRTCQRSEMPAIAYKNTETLEDCMSEAKWARGLALNFGAAARSEQKLKGSEVFEVLLNGKNYQRITRPNATRSNENRESVWRRPQQYFNCHILACPENNTMRTLANDSRYDYYSLYGQPVGASPNYTCIPQLGLFTLQTTPTNFLNATNLCRNVTGIAGNLASLAHVASAARTDAFAKLLQTHNEQARRLRARKYSLAYVGLHFNRSYTSQSIEYFNMEDEPLRCFEFVAWAPGHPCVSDGFANLSCVAVTDRSTWKTVSCESELPYICELYTSWSDLSDTSLSGTSGPKTYASD